MYIFQSKQELIKFAVNFINTRINSLEKDINYCLKEKPFAPFPAILYCFSTIDLLGALFKGNAGDKAPTTAQSADYMKYFMNYSKDETELLQKIFRHKIVHLAQPKAVIKYKTKFISWKYHHKNTKQHLSYTMLTNSKFSLTPHWEIPCNEVFNISILKFMKDIKASSKKYIKSLKTSIDLQDNFETAIFQIYTPYTPKNQ